MIPMRRFLTLLIACLFAVQLSGKSSSKEPEVDFSIIEHMTELSRYLTPGQRIELIRIEEAIKRAEDQMRSGQSMQQRKPSKLNPDEDVKAIHERGKKLVEEGQEQVTSSKLRLVALLETAEQQRLTQVQALADRYRFSLESMGYETALQQAAEHVLADSWAAGYSHIFFDDVRTVSNGTSARIDAEIRNKTYDILVAIDGTRFTLSMPINLRYAATENGESQFTYDNESAFKGSKAALLAIEKIVISDGVDAVLAVRALDLHTFKLISSRVLPLDSTTEAGTARTIGGRLNVRNNLLSTLASLDTPYEFGWDLANGTDPDVTLAHSLLLQQTIHQNSGIEILETSFVDRTYTTNGESTGTSHQPTAVFQLETVNSNDSATKNYTVSARLTSNNQEIVIGEANFNNEAAN